MNNISNIKEVVQMLKEAAMLTMAIAMVSVFINGVAFMVETLRAIGRENMWKEK